MDEREQINQALDDALEYPNGFDFEAGSYVDPHIIRIVLNHADAERLVRELTKQLQDDLTLVDVYLWGDLSRATNNQLTEDESRARIAEWNDRVSK